MMTTPIRFACMAMLLLLVASRGAGGDDLRLLQASGVSSADLPRYLAKIDRLAAEFRETHSLTASDSPERNTASGQELHTFLHARVLRRSYLASASNVGRALDGGAFNCVSATLIYCLLADRCGIQAQAMSTRGHVWTRVYGAEGTIEIETTCHNWFELAEKYRGIPTARVSEAMRAHRRRILAGRALSERQMLAVLHFNRGVTLIRENRFAPAAWANLQAIALDPECQPARENLAALSKESALSPQENLGLESCLILWSIRSATWQTSPSLATL